MNISKLCTPAMIYFVISVIALAYSAFMKFNIMSLVFSGISILFWSWLLNYLCKKGYHVISWVILFLPFFFIFSLYR